MPISSVKYCINLDIFEQMATLGIFGRRDDNIFKIERTLDTNVSENDTTYRYTGHCMYVHTYLHTFDSSVPLVHVLKWTELYLILTARWMR